MYIKEHPPKVLNTTVSIKRYNFKQKAIFLHTYIQMQPVTIFSNEDQQSTTDWWIGNSVYYNWAQETYLF